MSVISPRLSQFIRGSIIIVILLFASPISAGTDPISEDSPVSATIPIRSQPAGDVLAPSVPILLRPFDGYYAPDYTPEFVWRRSTDPDGNFVEYTFYLNGIATYLGISNLGNSSGTGYTAIIVDDEIRLTPLQSFADGTYEWKVVAYDSVGHQASSTVWRVTIDTLAPPITLTDIDQYHNLTHSTLDPTSVPVNTHYQVIGPQAIPFTILTEPYLPVTIRALAVEDYQTSYSITGNADSQGLITLSLYLPADRYFIRISAIDRANLVSLLPDFQLTVVPGLAPQESIIIPLPGDQGSLVMRFPAPFHQFPATVAFVGSRPSLALMLLAMLAILIIILIIFLKKRPNLLLFDSHLHPLTAATIYHSYDGKPGVMIRHLRPLSNGRLYLRGLGRFSTLTIRTEAGTITLSIIRNRHIYTLYLSL